jgi:hypothetical protein
MCPTQRLAVALNVSVAVFILGLALREWLAGRV